MRRCRISLSLKCIFEKIEGEEEGYLVVEWDLNASTGCKERPIETWGIKNDSSRGKAIIKEKRMLIRKIEEDRKIKERGWIVANRNYGKIEEWTYIGEVGTSVIDYVVMNKKALKVIKVVKKENTTESDNILLEVEVEEK